MTIADVRLPIADLSTPNKCQGFAIGNRQSQIGNGFTLIEVILAVALSVGLFAAMIGFYRYAGGVRADVTSEIQLIQSRRLVLDRITEQLRSATAYPSAGLAMEGKTDSITFVTAALPPPSVYNVYDSNDKVPPPQQDVWIVSYNPRKVEDENKKIFIAGLETGVQKLLTVAVVVKEQPDSEEDEVKPQIETTLLSPHFRFVRFQYFDGSAWSTTWTQGELPRAVEVAIGYEPLEEGVEPKEYAHELFRRVIAIHAARRQQVGTVIRGLGGTP